MEFIKKLVISTVMLMVGSVAFAETKNSDGILPYGAKIVAGTHENEFYILEKGEKLPVQGIVAQKNNIQGLRVVIQKKAAGKLSKKSRHALDVPLKMVHQDKIGIHQLTDKKVVAKVNAALKGSDHKKVIKSLHELVDKKILVKLHDALKQRDQKALKTNIQKVVDKRRIEKLQNAIEHEIASQQRVSKRKMA